MRTANTNLLRSRIYFAYSNGDKIPTDPTIQSALSIFKMIKKMERPICNDEVDYKKELLNAKEDLENIFDVSKDDLKYLSKNNLYLKHQSMMVNSIYELLVRGEL